MFSIPEDAVEPAAASSWRIHKEDENTDSRIRMLMSKGTEPPMPPAPNRLKMPPIAPLEPHPACFRASG